MKSDEDVGSPGELATFRNQTRRLVGSLLGSLVVLGLGGCPTTGIAPPGPQAAPAQWNQGLYRPYPSQVQSQWPPVDQRPVWEQYPNDAGWQEPSWQ